MTHYDEILIGSGPAAYKLSNLLARTDHRVLVIEGNQFGGICPNYGCEPKIFLAGAARAVIQSQQLVGRGISHPAVLDWHQLMQTKLHRFNSWPAETKANIERTHDTISGYASLVDKHKVRVNGVNYEGERIIIATGQSPVVLPIIGNEYLHTSTEVLSLKDLPSRITIIGGGIVAMELATLVAAAGAKVTMLIHSNRILRAFPSQDVQKVVAAMEARGIRFEYNVTPEAIETADGGFVVQTDHGSFPTDYVIGATGRRPNLDRLHLERVGIKIDHQGIIVDEHLMTNIPGIYAVGDVVSRPEPKLTPVAEFEGQYLFDYLMGQEKAPIKYPVIGQATFSFPEVALAGVNPDQVIEDSAYQIHHQSLKYGSLKAGENDQTSELTLVYHDDHLVGVSAVGDHAADEVNYLIPMIGLKISRKQYQQVAIGIYPALGDNVGNWLK